MVKFVMPPNFPAPPGYLKLLKDLSALILTSYRGVIKHYLHNTRYTILSINKP